MDPSRARSSRLARDTEGPKDTPGLRTKTTVLDTGSLAVLNPFFRDDKTEVLNGESREGNVNILD